MEDRAADGQLVHELLRRMSALEDNVAFLEVWCEEHQDVLDRIVGAPAAPFVLADEEPVGGAHLRVVDLRDGAEPVASTEPEETDHERRVRQLRARIRRVRNGLPAGSADQRDVSRS